ncbi:MAG: metal ABC transporter substrate-binding protein [Thermodesulfobacteriota bacterium]
MRKLVSLAVCFIISLVLYVCPILAHASSSQAKNDLRILASFLPIYIFTGNVIQGVPGVSVELMLPPGTGCPHDYTLTPGDLKKIAASSVLVINGLGIEEFAGRPVQAANPDIKIIDASRGITPLKIKEGHHHDHKHHPGQINAHVWTSPALAAVQVRNIAESLSAIDPKHSELYRKNAADFTARLEKLISGVKDTAGRLKKRKVVTFHNVFDYLARDLGLTVVAYIEEDHGQLPSAGKLNKLIQTIQKEKVAAIFAEPQYPPRLAQVLSHETGVPFYVLDPVTTAQGTVGLDYYEKAMHVNLAILQKVLAGELTDGRNSYRTCKCKRNCKSGASSKECQCQHP